MKLTMYSGCTRGDKIDVDGIDLTDLPESKQIEIATEVFAKILETEGANSMLRDLINTHHEYYENMGICEQCGDYTVDYILEV